MATKTESEFKIERAAEQLGLTMTAEFIPWSQSSRKGEKNPSLNWKVSLAKTGRVFLDTDYTAGIGRCPSYKPGPMTVVQKEVFRLECEQGKACFYADGMGRAMSRSGEKTILPRLADVIYSLVSIAEAIDYPTFEEWADTFGYESDSRKAEATYRAHLDIGLRLHSAIGDSGLSLLREACQDY